MKPIDIKYIPEPNRYVILVPGAHAWLHVFCAPAFEQITGHRFEGIQTFKLVRVKPKKGPARATPAER